MTTRRSARSANSRVALGSSYVSEAMHKGIFSCSADTPVDTVARLMSREHIHAVVVSGVAAELDGDRQAWGIISDLDLLRAALTGADVKAGQIAAMEFLTVDATETLTRAAQMMAEYEVTHLIVTDPRTEHAVGVLSTHDVAGVIGAVAQ